ncbi:hypothetical protein GCM10020331_015250 [Ectobacillus funiculus]
MNWMFRLCLLIILARLEKATEHFIELGHTRIAHIAGPMNVILSRDRLKGYEQAMISHQLHIEPLYIKEGDFSLESGYNQMLHLLELEVPPTAVFLSLMT